MDRRLSVRRFGRRRADVGRTFGPTDPETGILHCDAAGGSAGSVGKICPKKVLHSPRSSCIILNAPQKPRHTGFKRNLRQGEGIWLVGQEAKTLPSHGRIMGSIPVRATRKHLSKERCFFVFFNDFIIKTFRKSFTITLNIFSYFPGGSGGAEALRNPAPPRVKMKRNDPRRRPDRKRCPARGQDMKGSLHACPTSNSTR